MAVIVLRKGQEWCRRADGPVVDKFHCIARHHGSQVRWLFQTCVLATDDASEPDQNFPYEKWLEAANATDQN